MSTMTQTGDGQAGSHREPQGGITLASVVLAVAATAALGTTAWLFWGELRESERLTHHHERLVEGIHGSQDVASQWSMEIGRVKNTPNSNFDGLAAFIAEMRPHVEAIRRSRAGLGELPGEAKWAVNAYLEKLREREDRIERFKSSFAIVRNSRRILAREAPLLAERAKREGLGTVEGATVELVAAATAFLERPRDAEEALLEEASARLEASSAGTALAGQAEIVLKHVQALRQHHALTEQRFNDAMRTDLEERGARLVKQLQAGETARMEGTVYLRSGVYGAIALIGLYWLILALRRSPARRIGAGDPQQRTEIRTEPRIHAAAPAGAEPPSLSERLSSRTAEREAEPETQAEEEPRLEDEAGAGGSPMGGAEAPEAGAPQTPTGGEHEDSEVGATTGIEERAEPDADPAANGWDARYDPSAPILRDEEDAAPRGIDWQDRYEAPAEEQGEGATEKEEAARPGRGPARVDRAARHAVMDRLQAVEHDVREATEAAEEARRLALDDPGSEETQMAWAAAAGRMAGARWMLQELLREAGRLPPGAAGEPARERIDLTALVGRRVDAAGEGAEARITATLVPGVCTHGSVEDLEVGVDLILEHAIRDARSRRGGGDVTVILDTEEGEAHLTCMEHGAEGVEASAPPSLALATARALVEAQQGSMEITTYPGQGTVVRVGLPQG